MSNSSAHPLLAGMLWFALCGVIGGDPASADEEHRHARLVGRVYGRGGSGVIVGAAIDATGDAHAIADEDGRFSIDVPAGEITVIVSAANYDLLRVDLRTKAGEVREVEYRPAPKASRYESNVAGRTGAEATPFQLSGDELRTAPGTLGDPLRAFTLLPGVAQPIPLLPLFVVRGAAPGSTGFILDGMRLPQLFHSLVGGGVINGSLVDKLDFHAGSYGASLGRYSGAIVEVTTRPARSDGQHMEISARLFDAGVAIELALARGVRITISGQVGYPNFILKQFDPPADVQYADYQFRLDWRGLTVQILGSRDKVDTGYGDRYATPLPLIQNPFQLSFHRIQVRERDRVGPLEIEAALVGGYDSFSNAQSGVTKLFANGRLLLKVRRGWFTLAGGADVEVSRYEPEHFETADTIGLPDELGDLGAAHTAIVGGAWIEGNGTWLDGRIAASLGARLDVYHDNSTTLIGIDPRLSLRVRLMPGLEVRAGGGVYQQPPAFPLPLPGLDTFALSAGLQRSTQASVSIDARLPSTFELSATGYYQWLHNVDELELVTTSCNLPAPDTLHGLPAKVVHPGDGTGYGMELLLRRKAGRFTGWIAYTLSQSTRHYSCGLRPSDFDQPHLLNLVLQIRLPWQLQFGAHLYFATGRPVTVVRGDNATGADRNNDRFPNYVQLDVRFDRQWRFASWTLGVYLEALNLTYSATLFGLDYQYSPTLGRSSTQLELFGIRWMLPSLGIKGSF